MYYILYRYRYDGDDDMDYKELKFSIKWNINERRIRLLCQAGKINGAKKIGKTVYTKYAVKPIDKDLAQIGFNFM